MAENYISTNMDTGVQVKEALERIAVYQPDVFTWKEISDAVTVNLKSPTVYSGIQDPGDYVIYKFSNGPSAIPSTLAPVLLSIRNGNICITVNGTSYLYNSSSDTWEDLDSIVTDDTVMWVKSDTAPTRTGNTFWFDISNKDDATDPHVDLKYYDTTDNTWKSVFNEDSYLKASELDPDHKELDIYKYVVDRIADVVGEYGDFLKHINNELTLVHVSAADRERYANLMTEEELRALIEETYRSAFEHLIDETIDDELPISNVEDKLDDLKTVFEDHLTDHISADDISTWTNKADGDHTHDYTTGTETIDGSQITSGIIPADKLPEEVKERYYEIAVGSAEAEFSNTSITDDDRKSKYHNGNGFYLAYTDEETGVTKHKWYRIIDQTKIGTDDWADGVVDFTAKDSKLIWSNIIGRPTTLEEFGITTDLYTKEQVDEKFKVYEDAANELKDRIDSLEDGTSDYEFTSTKIESIGIQELSVEPTEFTDISTGTIPQTDIIVKTTDGKIYKTTKNLNSTYRFNNTERTTQDAAEPIGAGFTETMIKEYEYVFEDEYSVYDQISYNGEAWYSVGPNMQLMKSIDGINWTAEDRDRDFSDSKCRLWVDEESGDILYSKYGWTYNEDEGIEVEDTGTYYKAKDSDEYVKISDLQIYSIITLTDGKYAIAYNHNENTATIVKSTDNTNWVSVSSEFAYCVKNNGGNLVYHDGKYIIIYNDYESNTFRVIASTDLQNWDQLFQSKDAYHFERDGYEKLYFFNDRYYIFREGLVISFTDSDYTPQLVSLSIDGNIVENGSFNNSSMWIDESINTLYIIYLNYDSKKYTLASSTDGIDFTSFYELSESTVIPLAFSCANDQFSVVGQYGIYTFYIYRAAMYSWNLNGNTLPLNDNIYLPYPQVVDVTEEEESITVDTTYTNGIRDSHEGGTYVFSGWDKTGDLHLTAESPFITTIHGIWNWTTMLEYKYAWNADDLGLTVELPKGGTAEYNSSIIVDTIYTDTYYSDEIVPKESTISDTNRYWKSVCYGNGKFVAVAYNDNISAYSTDGINWTETTISDTNRYWKSVCYGNGKFVAVAYNDNISAYSEDGINWTESTISSTSRGWQSVCYGNGKFVAICCHNFYSIHSTDGINWTEYKGVVDNGKIDNCSLYTIGYGNGLYVCAGLTYNSKRDYTALYYSIDGINFVELDVSSSFSPIISICYGNGKFVAIGKSIYNYVYYSTDGINWTESDISPRYWYSVCYGNGKFVVVADSSTVCAYSTDGINWTESTISDTSRNWYSVCYGDGKFVAIAYNSTISAYIKSDMYYIFNGWDRSDFIIIRDTIIYGTWEQKSRLSVNYSWDNAPTSLKTTPPVTTYHIPNSMVIVDTEYHANCIHKVDDEYYQFSGWDKDNFNIVEDINITGSWALTTQLGIGNWIENPFSSINANWSSICYGCGMYIVLLDNTNTYLYSYNGNEWYSDTLDVESIGSWYSVCYGNGTFVAVASDGYCLYNTWSVSNTLIWSERTISNTSRNWQSVCYGNGKFVAVALDDNISAYSEDGTTWTETTISDTSRYWTSVCYGNGKYVTVAGNSICAYSEDGINWTESTISNTSRNWQSVCYGNDKFVAVADGSTISAYSYDGITWIERTISDTTIYWYSVCYGNDKFVAVAHDSTTFAYSTNGINWTESNISDTAKKWNSICYGKETRTFVSVANDNVVIAYNIDPTKFIN